MNAEPRPDLAGSASRELCERYGLQSDPFADAPERFYGGGQRQHFLDSLGHLCRFGELLLVVTGDPGVGRSRLLSEFQRVEKNQLDIKNLQPDECASPAQLARVLWGLLRQTSPGPSEPLQAIQAFFSANRWQSPSGRRWVLMLDDANQMPMEVIEALALGFSEGARERAPVPLLVGLPEFADALQKRLGENAHWLHALPLRPLTEEESGQFVERCFEWAGGDPGGILGPRRVSELYRRSEGYIGRLKQVAPEVILGAPDLPQKVVTGPKNRRRQALWMVSALVLLSASYAIVSWQYQDPPDETVITSGEARDETGSEVERLRQAMAEAEQRLRPEPVPVEIDLDPEANISAPEEAEVVVPPGMPPLLPDSIGLSVEEILAAGLDTPGVPRVVEPEAVTPDAASEFVVNQASVAPEPAAESVVNQAPIAPVPAVSTSDETTADPVDDFVPAMPDRFKSRTWVKAIPPGSLTLQLLGSYSESTAIEFIKRHPGADLVYVRSTYKGRPWFVVLHGIYADRAGARTGLARLPEPLRRVEPWIRSTDGL